MSIVNVVKASAQYVALRLFWLLSVLFLAPVAAQAQTADLQVLVSGPSIANGGQTFEFDLTFNNNGIGSASGATFEIALPPNVTDVQLVCGVVSGGANCPTSTVSGSAVSGGLAAFPNTGKVTAKLTGRFPVAGASSVTTTATITPPLGVTDPNLGSNTAFVSTVISYVADLVVTKTQSSNVFVPGVPVTYTLTVKNNGPAAADGGLMSDQLLVSSNSIRLTTSSIQCAAFNGADCPSSGFSTVTNQTWGYLIGSNLGHMPAGGWLELTYTMTPTQIEPTPCSAAAAEIRNEFSVGTPAGVTDSNWSNNSPTTSIPIPAGAPCPQADLAVTKRASNTVYTPGVPFTYTMTVTNNGPLPVINAILGDTLKASYSNMDAVFVSCTPSGNAICPTSGFNGMSNSDVNYSLINATVPSLPVGDSLEIVYSVIARDKPGLTCGTPGGRITNTFSVLLPPEMRDPNYNNNSAEVYIETPPQPSCPPVDLKVTKTQSSNVFVPGQVITYTMTVTNSGPNAADQAMLYDSFYGHYAGQDLNISLRYKDCVASGGAQCPAASAFGEVLGSPYAPSVISTPVPKLPAGGLLVITYEMQGTYTGTGCSYATGLLRNEFAASEPSGTTELNRSDNQAVAEIYFQCTDVSVNKKVAPASVRAGDAVEYNIEVTNAGPSAVANVAFSDPLPTGFIFGSASCAVGTTPADCGAPPTYDASTRTVHSNIVNLGVNGMVRYTIQGVAGVIPGTYPNTAYAVVPSGVVDPIQTSNQSQINFEITNTISPVTVTKVIQGLTASGLPSALTFNGTVSCGAQQPSATWSVTVAAGASTGSSAPVAFFDGFPCTVTENVPPAAPLGYAWSGAPIISPSPTAVLGPQTPLTVTVTNALQRQTGGLILTKALSGPAAAIAQITGDFDFELQCGSDGNFPAKVHIVNGVSASATLTNLPANASCTVVETAAVPAPAQHLWSAPVFSASSVVIAEGVPGNVTVTNPLTANPGSLTVQKIVTGGPSGGVSGAFTFAVLCTPSNTPIVNAVVTLNTAASGNTVVTGIPAGDTCTVTEQAPPAAPKGYAWGALPAAVTTGPMAAGGNLSVQITNTLNKNDDDNPPGTAHPVPSLNEVALIGLSVLLGLFGASRMRRRSA